MWLMLGIVLVFAQVGFFIAWRTASPSNKFGDAFFGAIALAIVGIIPAVVTNAFMPNETRPEVIQIAEHPDGPDVRFNGSTYTFMQDTPRGWKQKDIHDYQYDVYVKYDDDSRFECDRYYSTWWSFDTGATRSVCTLYVPDADELK